VEKSEFLKILSEALELDDLELTEETQLRDLEEFDSLAIIALVALLDKHFDRRLGENELAEITTPGSLMDMLGRDKFA
jgi:acyl carrier protein